MHILLHHEFSLQVLLSRDICKNENDLPLRAKIVRLYLHVVVDAILSSITSFIVRVCFPLPVPVLLIVVIILVTGTGQTLVHVK